MSHKIVKIKASELIEDYELYPRNCVFDGHVYDLAEAIKAGAVMPPIVCCIKTKKIADGFHRRRAAIKVHGPDAELDAMLLTYKGDADIARDSMQRNAIHGRRMTTADLARCAVLAKRFRISREELAGLLNVTRERLNDITASRFAENKAGDVVVLRRPMQHLSGNKLTNRQESAVTKVGGNTAIVMFNQLIELIEANALPPGDEHLLTRMTTLHGLLDGLVAGGYQLKKNTG